MPDGDKTKAPILSKYAKATKVVGDPTKQGYKKQETIDNKTFYDKEAEKAISGGIPGADWEKKIQQMAASGVSPEELVKAGHISPTQIEKFRPFYKAVYTEPEVVIPKTAETSPFAGLRKGQQIINTDSDKLMTTVRFADINGQANKSVDRYFDPNTGQEIDNNASLKNGTYNPVYTGKSIKDYGDESLRSDAQGQTNMLNSINGVPVTKTGDTQILQDANKQGTLGSSTGGGFKKGGLVGKIKRYANGGNINDPEFENFKPENAGQTALTSTALNAALPGAGTAVGALTGAKDMLVGDMSEIDPATGKYVNKGKAQNAGLINGIWNMSGAGMLKTAIDPNKSLGEKALSIGTYGISDLIKNRKNVDSMEANNIAAVENPKKMAEQQAAQQSSLSKQLLDRSQGLANGGKIEGKGTGKSDSITAKVKEDSFIIPSENSATAETIRKVVLKAPIVKANLNQKDGEKVKLSNGEHMFTPKEVEKIENTLGDDVLDKLAPNSAKKEDMKEGEKNEKELHDDKQKLVRQKELLGLKDGGSLAEAMKSGNKTTPKKVPTYYSRKAAAEKVVPDYLQQTTTTLDVPSTDAEATLSQDAGQNNMQNERTVPIAESQTSSVVAPSGGLAGKFNMGNVGNIAESAIPFLQAGYGLSQLRKQGKRPVGELDKDYLKSIDAARTNLDLANAQAKYGFTPEESALLSQENQNLTNAQRYAARNLSGGSAGNAFNLERSAINNSFGRGLKAAVENRNLMLQKQGIAGDKQAYLDNLIANKANMSRTLFNDKMNAFQQNQSAGAGLLGAGLNNIIQGKRYQDELAALKNTQGIRNSTYNTLGQ